MTSRLSYAGRKFLGHNFQFLVPRFAEAADKGLFEEAVEREMQFAPFLDRAVADAPTVVVEADKSVGKAFLAQGVEGAGYGFRPRRLALAAYLFEGAEAAAVLVVTGKHAVAAAHDTRHEVAVGVGVCHALLVNHRLRRGTEVGPCRIERVFYFRHLFEQQGRAGIAFYAARAAACREVAAEIFGEEVGRYQYVAHLEQGKSLGSHSFRNAI